MPSPCLSAFLLGCAFTTPLLAQTFIPLGTNYIDGMSRNGMYVVSQQANGDIYRWNAATNQNLPLGFNIGANGFAIGVSDDGSIVAGTHRNAANQTMAFRWTAATGFTDLGDLPGGTTFSQARGMSADGNTIVGSSGSTAAGTRDEAFSWTAAT